MRAGVVGTGFIGVVHVEALRRLGIEVAGVVGSTPERARAKPGLPEPYESLEAMLDDGSVDVVHITSPNHVHHAQVLAALRAGKHVVCEKPLALTSAQTFELVEAAERSGLVHCTNFNIRFYGQCRAARGRVHAGELGRVFDVRGGYVQDWLLKDTDWNWRLDPVEGGGLRAVADIGSHWLDLVGFVTGKRVAGVLGDLATVHGTRRVPTGPVETFGDGDGDADVERVERPMSTEDIAHVLLRFDDGARGSLVLSQMSAGRKNRVWFEADGTEGALAWDAESQEQLWLGHRDRPNEVHWREPGPGSDYPAGHPEGFPDTFKQLYRAVYRAVEAGGMPDEPDFPTFRDGHEGVVLGEAIAASAREGRWVEVPR